MFQGLPTRSLTLGSLLSGASIFTVPYFQRPYSWSRKEAGVLLANICAAAGLDAVEAIEEDYFLGTILLIERSLGPGLPGSAEYGIVDGQQRLTTITILAAVIRDLLDETSPGTATASRLDALLDGRGSDSRRRFRLELSGRERRCLETFVLERKGCWSMPTCDTATPAEEAIIQVREHFLEQLKPFDAADLEQLAAYLCDYCHVVAIYTLDLDRAHRDFMVLNGRGKPLQRNDILKAELLGSVPAEAAPRAEAAWTRAADLTGDEFETLFSHIRAIHGKTSPAIIGSIRDIVSDVGGPLAFIDNELLPLAEAQALILSAARPDCRISDVATRNRLIYLSRLNGHDWVPSALLALKDYDRDPTRAGEIIAAIDRLAHVLRMQCLGGNKRAPRFAELLKTLREGDLAAAMVNGGPLAVSREQTRSMLFYLRDFHERSPAMCKMVLLRLSDELDGKLTRVDPCDWSVEHVLPMRPSATGDWRTIFPNAEERDSCTKSLGNLVVVTQKQNLAAKNGSLRRKQEIYRMPDRGLPILRITQDAIEAASWSPDDVRRREQLLIELIGRIWQLDIGTASSRAGGNAKTKPGDNDKRTAAE